MIPVAIDRPDQLAVVELRRYRQDDDLVKARVVTDRFGRADNGVLWWRQDDDLAAASRAAVSSYHHQSGTCRMGDPGAAGTVVGPDLAVLGTSGLAVADSSVMPLIPRANTNLASMMIGYRSADVITS